MSWRDDTGKLHIDNEDGEEYSLADILPSPINTEHEIFTKVLQEEVRKEIDKLPPRECMIIRMRLGIDNGIPMTLDAIGIEFGVTRERIRQVEAKAIRKLRKNKVLKELWDDRT